jgi:hypothetical protein
MPAESSVNQAVATPAIDVPGKYRLAMVLFAYIPLVHVAIVVGLLVLAWNGERSAALTLAAMTVLYLLPPLAVRLVLPGMKTERDAHVLGSRGFLVWWYATQWQIVFNRLPLLEEALRLVPGLYSTWLRLWGAKIGRLVYWSPGLRVSDRPLLTIGDRVVVGVDAKLYPHFLALLPSGVTELVLAPIQIGHDALVGGCSLLPAGVTIAPCEQTPGGRPFAPFTEFSGGSHRRTMRFRKDLE